ncbi:DUF2500 family protein [Clostridium polynesiense]|uniref:DUF2500 family protein n=1 Tax=Clostridium polynesiense TaxID=1325933 RepID=UPI00058B5BBC|nr:DUF2500 family protein [Clostridium polynesiense]
MKIIVFLTFVFAVVVILISLLYGFSVFLKNKKALLESEDATVISKKNVNNTSFISNYFLNNTSFLVVFKMDSKADKKFMVSKKIYDSLEINEKGILNYKGTKFIEFIKSGINL